MLPVSLGCPLLIAPNGFPNVYVRVTTLRRGSARNLPNVFLLGIITEKIELNGEFITQSTILPAMAYSKE